MPYRLIPPYLRPTRCHPPPHPQPQTQKPTPIPPAPPLAIQAARYHSKRSQQVRNACKEHTYGGGIGLDAYTHSVDEEGEETVGCRTGTRQTTGRINGGNSSGGSGDTRQGIRNRSASVAKLQREAIGGKHHVFLSSKVLISTLGECNELIDGALEARRNLNAAYKRAKRDNSWTILTGTHAWRCLAQYSHFL
jgi:hypothetical protein